MAGSTGRKISTFIELGGEQAFKQALSDASRQVRVMDADLKAVASEFKSTGDAQQYFSQKTELLKSKIAEQERYVDMLKAGVKAAAGTYGQASTQADGYRIKLSNATAKLYDMRRELEAADREAEEFGRDSVKVGRQIENGIGDGAEEAQKSMKGLVEQMQADIGSLKGSMAFSVASSVASTVTNVVQGIDNLVSGGMDTLKSNTAFELKAELTGHDVDKMWDYVDALTGIVGEREEIMNALGSLMNTGLSDDDMALAIRKFKVYSAYFGEEAKFEDLAESFQETIATNKVTGKFSEDVGRAMGIQEDTLNALLEQAETREEKAKATLTYIASLTDVADEEKIDEAYAKINEYERSVNAKEDAYAELAEAFIPVSTQVNDIFAELAKGITTSLKLWFGSEEEKAKIMEEAEQNKKKAEKIAKENYKKLINLFGAPENVTTTHVGEPLIPLSGESVFFTGREHGGQTGSFFGDEQAENAKKAAKEWTDAYAEGLEEGRPTVQDVLNAYWQTMGTENDPEEVAKNMMNRMKPTEEEIAELSTVFASMGVDTASMFGTAFGEVMDTAAQNAEISGNNAGVALGNGLNTGLSGAYDVAANWANQINAVLGSIGQGLSYSPVYGGASGTGNGSGGNSIIKLTSNTSLNGRVIAQTVNTYQARMASRGK